MIELTHGRDFVPTRLLRESMKQRRQFVRDKLGTEAIPVTSPAEMSSPLILSRQSKRISRPWGHYRQYARHEPGSVWLVEVKPDSEDGWRGQQVSDAIQHPARERKWIEVPNPSPAPPAR